MNWEEVLQSALTPSDWEVDIFLDFSQTLSPAIKKMVEEQIQTALGKQ